MTKEQLDKIVQQNIDDGAAFPYLLTHCPRSLALLDELLKKGQDTHEPMDWIALGLNGNRDHAIDHLRKMMGPRLIGDHDNHWLNAVCRLMFCLELLEAAKDVQTPGT